MSLNATSASESRVRGASDANPIGSSRETLLPIHNRADITMTSGEAAWLFSEDSRRFLDFSAGVAVVNMGHRHPEILAATKAQLDLVWHTSNHFWNLPMIGLASRLSQRFGDAQAFFCNSGAEANEAIIKYARKATGRSGIVALRESFHGRTCGALSITGQPAKRDMFYPLLPNVTFVGANDIDALRAAVTDDTGLLIMEVVQGEGGVRPLTAEFARASREVTRERKALLAFDEIQSGVGRTGTFFGFEGIGVKPDLVSMAKGLANGLPLGCMLVAKEVAGGFSVGDHATTFGGNPVACAAGCATLDALTNEVLTNCRRQGERISREVARLRSVREVRGRGLMIGCELGVPAIHAVEACRERGLLTTVAGSTVLRLTPPLIITDEDVGFALSVLKAVLN